MFLFKVFSEQIPSSCDSTKASYEEINFKGDSHPVIDAQ